MAAARGLAIVKSGGSFLGAARGGLNDSAASLVRQFFELFVGRRSLMAPGKRCSELSASAPMTPDEIQIAEALAGCSFAPGTTPKRFVRQMAVRDRQKPLTERQRAYLWAIAWSWHRQLPRDLVELARERSGGVGIRQDWLAAAREREKKAGAPATLLRTGARSGAGAQMALF